MKLVYKDTGKEVQKGDILTCSRGENYIAKYWREPDHGTGKISVVKKPEDKFGTEYYVSVFGLEWRDE